MTLAVELRRQYPRDWEPEGLLRLLADRATYGDILAGKPRRCDHGAMGCRIG